MSANYICKNQITASITTVSNQVLLSNPYRKYLFIQNQGTDKIFIQFETPQVTKTGKILLPGSAYEPLMPPVQSIYLIANSGTQSVFICEGAEV